MSFADEIRTKIGEIQTAIAQLETKTESSGTRMGAAFDKFAARARRAAEETKAVGTGVDSIGRVADSVAAKLGNSMASQARGIALQFIGINAFWSMAMAKIDEYQAKAASAAQAQRQFTQATLPLGGDLARSRRQILQSSVMVMPDEAAQAALSFTKAGGKAADIGQVGSLLDMAVAIGLPTKDVAEIAGRGFSAGLNQRQVRDLVVGNRNDTSHLAKLSPALMRIKATQAAGSADRYAANLALDPEDAQTLSLRIVEVAKAKTDIRIGSQGRDIEKVLESFSDYNDRIKAAELVKPGFGKNRMLFTIGGPLAISSALGARVQLPAAPDDDHRYGIRADRYQNEIEKNTSISNLVEDPNGKSLPPLIIGAPPRMVYPGDRARSIPAIAPTVAPAAFDALVPPVTDDRAGGRVSPTMGPQGVFILGDKTKRPTPEPMRDD